MKCKLAIFLLPAVLLGTICHGGDLTKITSSNFDGAITRFEGDQLVVDNMRATSKTTTMADYIRGEFKFSNATEDFAWTNFQVFQNVGVYNTIIFDHFFVRNADTPIVLKNEAGGKFVEDNTYNVSTAGSPFKATMEVGQVISFEMGNFSRETRFTVTAPNHAVLVDGYFEGGSGFITGGIPALQSGTYTIAFAPESGKTPATFAMRFGNANRQKLVNVADGSYLSTDLRENLRDYYKYAIYLDAGDQLTVDQPSENAMRLVLLDSTSAFQIDNVGVGALYVAKKAGNYYLFISDSRGWGSNYYGYVHVTKAATPADFAAAEEGTHTVNTFGGPSKPRD